MQKYFITGTDTDCGKTYVTCQLLDYLTGKKASALGIKPIASGCMMQNNQLISGDVQQLQCHNPSGSQEITKWTYAPPVSPHIASRQKGDFIRVNDVLEFCMRDEFSIYDYLLIEGAGGLLVPINEQETWLDFLKISRIPVILTVGMRLGCINHALLTDSVLKSANIPCLGWIANHVDSNMLVVDENLAILSSKMHMPLIATVPYCGKISHVAGF